MKRNNYTDSIVATATVSNKTENQDAFGEFEGPVLKSIYVADGLGSFKYPQKSAKIVIDFFNDTAAGYQDGLTILNFDEIFLGAKERIVEVCNQENNATETGEQNLYGTTAIKVCEINDTLSMAYTGNGAIWHIRGNFSEFPSHYYFPWCIVNYLNPHSVAENGKEALYKLISNAKNSNECSPSVLEISKDKFYGDIIIICTDGIYSADQIRVGKNEKGIWVKVSTMLIKLVEHLNNFFKTKDQYNKQGLNQILEHYMQEIKKDIDDDATVGILITKEALNYQSKINSGDGHTGYTSA